MDEPVFDLSACLDRVRQRDEEAARLLVEHLYPLVIKIVRGKLPRRQAEEDLAQEIFVKMFAKLDQYEGRMPFEHWLARIAVNHCLNANRFQNSRPEWRWSDLSEDQALVLETITATGEPHPADALDAQAIVAKLLDSLDPQDAWLLRLLELEERSVEEVRELTGWSATRIRVRAFRARRKLNQRFATLKQELGL